MALDNNEEKVLFRSQAGSGAFRCIEPMREAFVGAWMAYDERYRGLTNQELFEKQVFIQALFESRMASLQRYVAFLVMFHAMGKRVADFWPRISCGLLGYDMSHTHSIMRIATTASPVSGMDVREKTLEFAQASADAWAKRILQDFAAFWYCFGKGASIRGRKSSPGRTDAMLKIIYAHRVIINIRTTSSPAH